MNQLLCIALVVMATLMTLATSQTVTVTKTSVVTKTTSATTVVKSLCASLVNVTGACRRRRGLAVEEPTILSLDEDEDDPVRRYFFPSKPVVVEVTPLATSSNISSRISSVAIQSQGRNTIKIHPSIEMVQPSIGENGQLFEDTVAPLWGWTGTDIETLGQAHQQQLSANPTLARVYFSQLAQLFTALFGSTTTTTVTSTSTSTSFSTSTSKITFLIQTCTPSPFAFSTC